MSTLRPPAVWVKFSEVARAFWSKAWVTEPVRISETRVIEAPSGVPTKALDPYWTVAGAEVMVGRAPLNR